MTNTPTLRQFIFGFNKPLADRKEQLQSEIEDFISTWNAHGALIKSTYLIIEDQFLIIEVSSESETPSGCSIDSFTGKINSLAEQLDLQLFDENDVVYENKIGFTSCSRQDFKSRLKNGEFTADSLVADLSQHQRSSDEELSVIKKISESWLARYL